MRTWSDTRQAATGGKPRVDAHLSADQRQAHPRAAVAVNPLASSLHGPSASQSVQAQSFKSLRAQQAGGRTTRTDGRTPAPRRRDSATAFWNLWDIGRLFLAFGKARLAISHLLVTHQSTSSVALTDNAHSSRTSPKRRAPAEASNAWARARRARLRPHCGVLWALWPHAHGTRGVSLCLAWGISAPCRKLTRDTRKDPLSSHPSFKQRQPCCSRVGEVRQNIRALGTPLHAAPF